jgi:zinc/manganese transport system substrate-binding protein
MRKAHTGARVAITEPVFDYLLHAAGLTIATPASFSHAIEEGNDPAPQDVDTMQALLAKREVAAFVYNRQTVEPATTRLLAIANSAHVHVVPVSETLPGGETTQIWIDAETGALDRAL